MIKKVLNIYKNNKEIINYLIVGGLTTVVSFLSYYLVRLLILPDKTDLNVQIASAISWICAVAFAYITNKLFVFESKAKGKKAIKEITSFVSTRLFTLLIDLAGMYLMVSILDISELISKLVVQVLVTITNYVLSKILVFKKTKEEYYAENSK